METTNTNADNNSVQSPVDESTVAKVASEVGEKLTSEDGLLKIARAISSGSMISLKTLSKLDIDFEFNNLKKIFNGELDFSLGSDSDGWRIVHKYMVRNEKCKLNKEDYTSKYIEKFPEDFYIPWIFNITRNDGSTKTIRLTDLKDAISSEEYEFIRIFMDLSNKKYK
jgi:hypothetical protein